MAKARVLRELEISPAQHQALTIIHGWPGVTSAEVARRCLVTPQTMASTVAKLELAGLVRREQHPLHGTLIELRLTERGTATFACADDRIDVLEVALTAGLRETEAAQLCDLLKQVAANAVSV